MNAAADPAESRGGTWLCPTPAHARRLESALGQAAPARIVGESLTQVCLMALVPWLGWWPVIANTVAMAMLIVVRVGARRVSRPEYLHAASFGVTTACIAAAVAATGGPSSPLLVVLVFPLVMLASRFRSAVVWWGFGISVAATAVITAIAFPARTLHHPVPAVITVVTLLSATLITLSFQSVEEDLRARTFSDPLTGLLNRLALETQYPDTAGLLSAGGPHALALVDLDHFKSVNDTHGHDVGDGVLVGLGEILRGGVRGIDRVYRLGGEEFGVLFPGADAEQAHAVAERLRAHIAEAAPGGVDVTASFGVADAPAGTADWDDLYRRADRALLQAKTEGRDRVVRHGEPPAGTGPPRQVTVPT